jgi:ribose 5-phosphate isomerase B
MRIIVGADNRGLVVRERIRDLLEALGYEVEVVESPEYPDIAARVAHLVQQCKDDRGILIARTGMGMCIVANKVAGIRATVCSDEFMAETSRRYLDANVLCLSAELLGVESVEAVVKTWLNTPFEGGRHARRVERISAIERGDSAAAAAAKDMDNE